MTDLTPLLNELLRSHDAPPTAKPSLTLQNIDEFLKEAYRIVCDIKWSLYFKANSNWQNSHIASLNVYLRKIRQSYLSTAAPPRRTNLSAKDRQWKYLTDRQREEIDAETKQLLRELNASIRNLADAEQLRQNTETTVIRRKYAKLGLGSLGKWAAGGAGQTKSSEQELEESKANVISSHRENVIWYLRQKLQECGKFQATMMEKRIMREMEKRRSVLANSDMDFMPEILEPSPISPSTHQSPSTHLDTQPQYQEEELSAEQIQIFEKENQDMLKYYESTLDQVRYAETTSP
jgi:syntaxin 18